MIRCQRRKLRELCEQRGYAWDGVQACIVRDEGHSLVVDDRHPAYPRVRPGLGDMVAAGLSAVGITMERVSAVLGRPCNCPGRQAALNRLGAKLGLPPGRAS